MDNYQEMVIAILENKDIPKRMTARELSHETGATERAVTGWKNGAIPQNLLVRETIKRLYKKRIEDER